MKENIQAMVVALFAVSFGIVFTLVGSQPFFRIVGIMFIMGAFIIAITAFLLFLKEWIVAGGTS